MTEIELCRCKEPQPHLILDYEHKCKYGYPKGKVIRRVFKPVCKACDKLIEYQLYPRLDIID